MSLSIQTPVRKLMLAAAATALLSGTAVTAGLISIPQFANAQISVTSPMPASFADLVDAVKPAVVSIQVRTERRQRGDGQFGFEYGIPELPEGHPFERFFRDFQERFGQGGQRGENREQRPQRRQFTEAVGSGFVISADGYVVTNNHVVERADEVTVVLDDGRELTADIVGTDPRTDLAVLKVQDATDLKFVEFAETEARVGDWVVAVGNPFGLGGSVTAGIVSARGRDINAGAYDDFLQIDAAVNRGNSGGPAFNTAGEVVGVNTAIFSPTGGNIGIAFAIPTSTVQDIVNDLIDSGSVTRGYLGVSIQPVTNAIAASVGLDEARGAMVTEPQADQPAIQAGVESGDIILEVDGRDIDTVRELTREIGFKEPGETVELTVWRDGQRITIPVTLATLEEAPEVAAEEPVAPQPDPEPTPSAAGLTVMANPDGAGVVISEVDPDSAAVEAGLMPGDVILEANDREIASAADLEAAVADVEASGRDTMLVKVTRNGNVSFLGLPIGS